MNSLTFVEFRPSSDSFKLIMRFGFQHSRVSKHHTPQGRLPFKNCTSRSNFIPSRSLRKGTCWAQEHTFIFEFELRNCHLIGAETSISECAQARIWTRPYPRWQVETQTCQMHICAQNNVIRPVSILRTHCVSTIPSFGFKFMGDWNIRQVHGCSP